MIKLSNFTTKLSLVAVLTGVFAVTGIGLANEVGSQNNGSKVLLKLIKSEAVQLEDLGTETSVILQTNPFYFMKSWRRSTQRTFTFSAIKKVELEFGILNEKAAELKTLKEIRPGDSEAFLKALENYNGNLSRLASLIVSLRDNSDNPEVDRLLDTAVDSALRHYQLLEELKIGSDNLTRQHLNNSQYQLGAVVSDLAIRLDTAERFSDRLSRIYRSYPRFVLRQIWGLGGLEKIWENLPKESRVADQILLVKESWLLELESKLLLGELSPELFVYLESLAGGTPRWILLVDDLRELTVDAELKSELSETRQELLDQAVKNRRLSKPEAEETLARAKSLAANLESRLVGADSRGPAFLILVSSVDFNITQAEESYAKNQYGSAFGQASIAAAAATNALSQLIRLEEVAGGLKRADLEIKDLKSKFDILNRDAALAGATPEDFPYLFVLFGEAEKSLVKAADSAVGKINIDSLISAIRRARLDLAEVEQSLNIIKRHLEAEAKKSKKPLIERVLPSK